MNTLTKTLLAGHRTIHMSVDIAGVLRWSDKELVNMFTDEDGNRRPAAYVRDWLKLQLAQGKRVLPMGECDGFSYTDGCPGHPCESSNSQGSATPEDKQ